MATSPPATDKLSEILSLAVYMTGLSQTEFAARCHMSQRTLARYSFGTHVPPKSRAIPILHAASGVLPDVYRRLGDALGVPEHQRPPSLAARTPAAQSAEERRALLLTLFTAAEANGVAPRAARNIALATLSHARTRGLDIVTAEQVVAGVIQEAEAAASGR
jgi:transcriptional regulator with XRE-family HTH domain